MSNVILIKYPKNWGLSEKLVIGLLNKALVNKNLEDVEISVVFVGRKRAKDLNIRYRNKSYIPQVLGFPMDKVKSEDGWIHLGDIVICTEKLKYEVKFQKKRLDIVLEEWLLHGVENLQKC
jgi:rRNA maturation RNase YbeY